MKIDWSRLTGLITVVFVLLVFCMVIISYEFPAFQYENFSPELVKIEINKIGSEVSRFLWDYRLIDLIAQAFVLFAAAACCVAMLRTREKK
ncbi:MAG: hypothetical protein U9O89_06785 [Thermoproteota archaeon]|nr:hypothetical protein [Thermoproteota archaeon]